MQINKTIKIQKYSDTIHCISVYSATQAAKILDDALQLSSHCFLAADMQRFACL